MTKNMYQKRKERQENKKNETSNENKTNINWYPGHMTKTKREIKEILSTIDVVVEVIDSRIPLSSHIEDLNDFINDKHTIIVFNKYDLCDKEKINDFINYYENLGYKVITSDAKNSNDYKKVVSYITNFMKDINLKRKAKNLLPRKANVLVVGVPNTGKSTLINKIVGRNISDTGNRPGVTKSLNKIKINEFLNLIDSPGILWPKIKDEETALNLASMTTIKESIVPSHKLALHILDKLNSNYKSILKKSLGVENVDFDAIESLYEEIGKFKGVPKYQGEPDYDRISEMIINMIKQEKIKGITFDKLS